MDRRAFDHAGSHGRTSAAAPRDIEEVVPLEQAPRRRPFAGHIADLTAGFSGTVAFVSLDLLWFGAWTSAPGWSPSSRPLPFPVPGHARRDGQRRGWLTPEERG
jgi:hypothetical protein